jgi:hypothetical protein
MVTLILRQGERGKQTLLSFPARTPAARDENAEILASLRKETAPVFIESAASPVLNLGCYLRGVDILAEGEAERIQQLAERLEQMSEIDCDKFAGMLDANSISDTKDILNLTERLDDYTILPNCSSPRSIGRYLVDCGAFPVPEKLSGYIDYGAVGTEFQNEHGGAVCCRGYVVRKEGLPQAVLKDLYSDVKPAIQEMTF